MSESPDEPAEGEGPHPVVGLLQTITPGFIRRNFALKFGLVLLIMALSIGVIGFVATQAVTAETEENVQAEFQGDAGQQADIVEQWLASNSLQVEISSDKGDYDAPDRADVQTELDRDLERARDDVHNMHVIEDDPTVGFQVFASTGTVDEDIFVGDWEEREWLLESGDGDIRIMIEGLGPNDVYVSETYQADGDHLVAFISPDADRPEDRYLMVEVSVTQVQNTLRGADPDADVGFTQVVHPGEYLQEDGEVNYVMMDARPAGDRLLEVYATDANTLEPIELATDLRDETERAGVIAEMDADPDVIDEVYTVGYAPVEHDDSEWVVLVHGARSDVFGFVDTLGTWGLIVTLISVLLIGVTGAVLGYSTSTSIDRLTQKTEEMRGGDLDVNLYSSRVDNIGQLYAGFATMRDALKQQIEESERARKEAEVARAEAVKMAEYLQEKAEEYSNIMQQVGQGDLTQRMSKDGEEESMDRIADQFNEMIEELEKTTGQLKNYVDEVEDAGGEVEQSANTVREASEQVADSIQKISDDAYDQKERLENIANTMDQIADDLEGFAATQPAVEFDDELAELQDIATQIMELSELSEETMAEAQQVAGAAEEQAAELNEVSERANDLQRYAQPLRDILQRFETEAEHEFVFSVGPTGGAASPSSQAAQDDEEDEQ